MVELAEEPQQLGVGPDRLLATELIGQFRPRLCMWARRCSDGRVSWLSEGFADLFGRDPDEFLWRADVRELVHPLDLELFVGGADEIADRALLWRTVRPDGDLRWVRSQVVATVEMPSGEHHWVGVIEDVTHEVLERQHRREMESAFAELKFALNDADAEDLDGAIDHGLRLLGELVGADRSYLFRLHGDGLLSNTHEWCAEGVEPVIGMLQNQSVDDVSWAMQRLAEGPQVLAVAELPPDSGEVRPMLEAQGIHTLVLVPTLLRGRITGFVGFDSVVDRREWHDGDIEILERFARAVQSALDRADAQRHTREALAELVAAREAAETASEAKSRLLSRVSHELRTPVSVVATSAELLARGPLGADELAHVEQILRATREQLAMIDDLLEIARSDHRSAGALLDLDVADLCSSLLRVGTQHTGLASSLHADGLVSMRTDPELVRQVVSNLISNAVKYNRPDGRVDVRVVGSDDDLQIVISDTGHGIDDEGLEVLWEPFERLGAESGDVPGTGLGLAIVAHALDELGGSIQVDSSTSGSTFTVTLPRGGAPGLNDAAVSVLLVDDHDAVRRMTDSVLRQVGGFQDIRHATSCAEALAEVARAVPSIVLLDRHLPDGSGEAVIASLRNLPGAEGLPIVIVSADATEASRRRSLDAGADEYVVKPAPVTDLVELVRSSVRR
jgi:signal transduction histidine kinase